MSVFAVTGDVTDAAIVEALPQRSFARSTVGTVTGAGFELLGSSIVDPDADPSIVAIQHVHYDIVLPALDPEIQLRDSRRAGLDAVQTPDARLGLNGATVGPSLSTIRR